MAVAEHHRRFVAASAVASYCPAVRDRRLDLWRGLCLVDMIVVHRLYQGVQFGRALTPAVGNAITATLSLGFERPPNFASNAGTGAESPLGSSGATAGAGLA